MGTPLHSCWRFAFAIAAAMAGDAAVHGVAPAPASRLERPMAASDVVERWRLDGLCAVVTADAAGTGVQCDAVWIAPVVLIDVHELLLASPTFRRQFAVARSHGVQVKVALTDDCLVGARRCEGATTISRYAGNKTLAIVRLRKGGPIVRMLGHEFEHLREWCEGVLRLGTIGHAGQRSETARAVDAGRQVEREHAAWLRSTLTTS